jgi:hypothetical protein
MNAPLSISDITADLRYLKEHAAEAYLHGFDTRDDGVYFKDLHLEPMNEQ